MNLVVDCGSAGFEKPEGILNGNRSARGGKTFCGARSEFIFGLDRTDESRTESVMRQNFRGKNSKKVETKA